VSKDTSLGELITTLDILSDKLQSPVLLEASMRLDQVSDALINLEHALFYIRMYQSTDNTGEGEKRRQQLIDDSEAIIPLIRNGGRYYEP
jgi:hypothetical protein